MPTGEISGGTALEWSDDALELQVVLEQDSFPHLGYLAPPGQIGAMPAATTPATGSLPGGLPLVDVVLGGTGRAWAGRRYSESVVGQRLRLVDHLQRDDGLWHRTELRLGDPVSGLEALVSYQVLRGAGVLRSQVTVTNRGAGPLDLESVTSFLGGGLPGPAGTLDDVDLMWAENDWMAESRWQSRPFRDALPTWGPADGERSRGRFALTSLGTWSSGTYLPMGAALNRKTGFCLLWQIDHNGSWQWQVGEHLGRGAGASYLALLGPTDAEHHWRVTLSPGESFQTVPVALAVSNGGFEGAVAGLTRYRRAIRRAHEDHRSLPVIFNDYMNTLMGDPTTERLLPLVSAAAQAGAEYFCIDAGWYAEVGEAWWETVGAWVPSKSRFPKGIAEVLDRIRDEGMVPGLWLEPEVVGTRSPVAGELPDDAFFVRNGLRVVEQGRYQLDFCHPAARRHLDQVVDFLVGELGVGYLKMDYNINVAPGTEVHGAAPGAGLLAHNRAYLGWVDGLLDRHNRLTIEDCSSGGMRTDYGLLSRCQLLSTSDQEDFLYYPPIAASAPAAVTAEQAAVWAYPQPEWDDDRIAFTMCNAMLGRVHLSGFLDRMSTHQRGLVAEGVEVYKQIRHNLASSVPFWPLGLPKWTAPWVALGARSPEAAYLAVWHRPGGQEGASGPSIASEVVLPLGNRGWTGQPRVIFPDQTAELDWEPGRGELTVRLARAPSACIVEVARQR